MERADSVGGFLAPHEGPPGPHSTLGDVSSPSATPICFCSPTGQDRVSDLKLFFQSERLTDVLQLGSFSPGAVVELVLSGSLQGGQTFQASDCIRLVPRRRARGLVTVNSNVSKAWIYSTPPDLQMDGGGFTDFARSFPVGTLVTLTASTANGNQTFTGWRLNGQSMGFAPMIQVSVSQITSELEALYVPVIHGDMNGDGVVDLGDVSGYVDALLAESPAPFVTASADMNADGTANGADVFLFVSRLLIP